MFQPLRIALVLFLLDSVTLANNNYFLPGDAFFAATLTKDQMEAVNDSGRWVIPYTRGAVDPGQFSGHAGYKTLELSGDRLPELRQEMLRAFDFFSKDLSGGGGTEGGIRVLIYNKTFDFNKYRIGITYNERWREDVKLFGHDGEIRLCPFVSLREGVVDCWRHGEAVERLAVELPKVEILNRKAVESAMAIDAGSVCVVALGFERSSMSRREKNRLFNRAFLGKSSFVIFGAGTEYKIVPPSKKTR